MGAVLASRVQHQTSRPKRGKRQAEARLIASLIPVADGPMAEEMATALSERQAMIEARALALVDTAVERGEPWLKRLGEPPADPPARQRWLHELRTVAAYRDRYCVDTQTAVGDDFRTDAQKLDAARAAQAIRRARVISEASSDRGPRSQAVRSSGRAIGWRSSTC